uniref:Uncharacterized protein n=1 Tax=Myotis myotis TaxID=51298 RepID=A0A7J7SCH9_MYOMY|nr:hypothetical protein mMyoMyo1_009494 [Myotis myotis]
MPNENMTYLQDPIFGNILDCSQEAELKPNTSLSSADYVVHLGAEAPAGFQVAREQPCLDGLCYLFASCAASWSLRFLTWYRILKCDEMQPFACSWTKQSPGTWLAHEDDPSMPAEICREWEP